MRRTSLSIRHPIVVFFVVGVLVGVIITLSSVLAFIQISDRQISSVSDITSLATVSNDLVSASDSEPFDGVTPIDPPIPLSDFTLTSQTGDPISLYDLRGKPVVLTFGYTNCPDICPLTLDEFKFIQQNLGDQANDVTFVFISVDGERDTPEQLTRYFELRGIPDLVGMTGTADEVRQMGNEYNLFFEQNTTSDTAASFLVSHTGGSFLINQESQWVARFAFGTDPKLLLDGIQRLLSGG